MLRKTGKCTRVTTHGVNSKKTTLICSEQELAIIHEALALFYSRVDVKHLDNLNSTRLPIELSIKSLDKLLKMTHKMIINLNTRKRYASIRV